MAPGDTQRSPHPNLTWRVGIIPIAAARASARLSYRGRKMSAAAESGGADGFPLLKLTATTIADNAAHFTVGCTQYRPEASTQQRGPLTSIQHDQERSRSLPAAGSRPVAATDAHGLGSSTNLFGALGETGGQQSFVRSPRGRLANVKLERDSFSPAPGVNHPPGVGKVTLYRQSTTARSGPIRYAGGGNPPLGVVAPILTPPFNSGIRDRLLCGHLSFRRPQGCNAHRSLRTSNTTASTFRFRNGSAATPPELHTAASNVLRRKPRHGSE